MEKTMVEDELEKQNLTTPIEKLKADASGILICVRKLKGLQKHNEMVEANIEKRSQELELKEKELQKLSSDLDERVGMFEAEKAKPGDLKKSVEDCTDELRSKRNELSAKLDTSMRIQREIELRKKHLEKVVADLRRVYNEASKSQERQREVDVETARKKKDLGLVLVKIQESNKKLEEISREVELKKGKFFEVEKSEADMNVKCDGLKKEIEEKGKELDLVKSQVKSWEKKLIQVKKLVNDSTVELISRKDRGEAVGEAKTVLVKHNGVEEENLVNEPYHPPVIYTYQRRVMKKLEKSFYFGIISKYVK